MNVMKRALAGIKETGAPRPTKMGTIVSPRRYDAGAYHTLDDGKPHPSAI